ncbi:tryptophan aminotransferase-related protein 4-like [Durio zibethinus]|uniref:Tryptophan aminotransferase-related protein 4-like n=1 Tax=Durio zibethinus TaxID=66656 RepID=A0A6P6B8U7_DURZI|nr:tryptophan aminotransferase-related protein 4-like [Durio zibethinus]
MIGIFKKEKEMNSACLVSSIILNLLFIINIYMGGQRKLSWSRRAAEEAEAVAAISCSGHGRAYLDGLVVDGNKPVCECNTCFTGPDCSQFIPDCTANAESGDPLFLEPFWMQHLASSALVVAGWHQMSYSYNDKTFISKELEKLIRKVHAIVGNAVTEDRFIVFGAGSTQVLIAAAYALSLENTSSPVGVVASVPYYTLDKLQPEYFNSEKFKFEGDAYTWRNRSDARANMIEFVTSPNNPDGQLKKAVLHGPNVKTIHDHAYYWPHFTPIPAPADEDLMVFTLSKLTGHAGSRFGWAVIKDETVFNRMIAHMELNSMGVSKDSQLRTFKLLKAALEEGTEIFDFAYQTMKTRWERLIETLSLSNRFSLQKIDPQYCTFYNKVREPSPAYAWLKCEREEDKDCNAVLMAANIIGRQGSRFGTEDCYVRLSLIRSQDDFNILMERLNKLVAEEDGAKTM